MVPARSRTTRIATSPSLSASTQPVEQAARPGGVSAGVSGAPAIGRHARLDPGNVLAASGPGRLVAGAARGGSTHGCSPHLTSPADEVCSAVRVGGRVDVRMEAPGGEGVCRRGPRGPGWGTGRSGARNRRTDERREMRVVGGQIARHRHQRLPRRREPRREGQAPDQQQAARAQDHQDPRRRSHGHRRARFSGIARALARDRPATPARDPRRTAARGPAPGGSAARD